MRNSPGVAVASAVKVPVAVNPEPEKLKVKVSAKAAGVTSIAASVIPERVSKLRFIRVPLAGSLYPLSKPDVYRGELVIHGPMIIVSSDVIALAQIWRDGSVF